jgi:surfactin synthase thioesterase subunit
MAARRLVCFPHAGGSAPFYHPVSAALSPEVDVVCLQYPGRQDRRSEPGIEDIDTLADQIFEALGPWTDTPLTFFGHSMGAVLAFEVARRFEAIGPEPIRLFASGRRAPSRYRDENVHRQSDDGIVAEMRAMSGTDARIMADEEMLRMVLPALRSDYKAVETYRCEAGASVYCPVTVLVGDSDTKTTLEEARAWEEHTTGEFDMKVFPGGHFYLNQRATEVIAVLKEHLAVLGPTGA